MPELKTLDSPESSGLLLEIKEPGVQTRPKLHMQFGGFYPFDDGWDSGLDWDGGYDMDGFDGDQFDGWDGDV